MLQELLLPAAQNHTPLFHFEIPKRHVHMTYPLFRAFRDSSFFSDPAPGDLPALIAVADFDYILNKAIFDHATDAPLKDRTAS